MSNAREINILKELLSFNNNQIAVKIKNKRRVDRWIRLETQTTQKESV